MKPYKIYNTWVDLDHVLAIDDEPTVPDGSFYIFGYITMMFKDNPLSICLGRPALVNDSSRRGGVNYVPSDQSIQTWEAFKTAWMNRDKIT